MPHSPTSRKRFAENLRNLAAEYALYSNTSDLAALDASEGWIRGFFESRGFKTWAQNREAEYKLQQAIAGRLDGVIRSIGALGKALSS